MSDLRYVKDLLIKEKELTEQLKKRIKDLELELIYAGGATLQDLGR